MDGPTRRRMALHRAGQIHADAFIESFNGRLRDKWMPSDHGLWWDCKRRGGPRKIGARTWKPRWKSKPRLYRNGFDAIDINAERHDRRLFFGWQADRHRV